MCHFYQCDIYTFHFHEIQNCDIISKCLLHSKVSWHINILVLFTVEIQLDLGLQLDVRCLKLVSFSVADEVGAGSKCKGVSLKCLSCGNRDVKVS